MVTQILPAVETQLLHTWWKNVRKVENEKFLRFERGD